MKSYYFNLLRAIVNKDIIYLKRYWLNTIFSTIMMFLFFFFLLIGMQQTDLISGNVSSLLGGYVTWIFMTTIFSTHVTSTANEAALGTLEQLYINSKQFYLTIILQAMSTFLIIAIQISIVIIFCAIIGIVPYDFIIRYLCAFPFFLLGVPALWGMGLFFSAIVLRYKNITSVYTTLSTLFFALISYMSQSTFNWETILVPFLPSSSYIQTIMSKGFCLNALIIFEIMLNSTLFLLVGVIFFRKYERFSKNNATFAKH